MTEYEIDHIEAARYVAKIGKYRVKLAFREEHAKEVWMTECQLSQIERAFEATPKGYSTQRVWVTGVWNDNGYYAYARVEKEPFIPPEEQDLRDLIDEA